jgi:hypothetical protein
MPFRFDETSANNPKGVLIQFLYDLRRLLGNFVRDTVEGFDFKPDLGEHRDLIDRALVEADDRRYFQRAAAGIESVTDTALSDTGLSGDNLRVNLVVLTSFSDRMRGGFRKAIKYILDVVNKLLGSIKAALSAAGGVVIDAIAELKDIIKAKIEFINEW